MVEEHLLRHDSAFAQAEQLKNAVLFAGEVDLLAPLGDTAPRRSKPDFADLVSGKCKGRVSRDQGKSLNDVLAANLTAPYDTTTQGDTQQSKDRFITEVYDEVKDFPPVVNGERKMPRRTGPGR